MDLSSGTQDRPEQHAEEQSVNQKCQAASEQRGRRAHSRGGEAGPCGREAGACDAVAAAEGGTRNEDRRDVVLAAGVVACGHQVLGHLERIAVILLNNLLDLAGVI